MPLSFVTNAPGDVSKSLDATLKNNAVSTGVPWYRYDTLQRADNPSLMIRCLSSFHFVQV